MFRTIFNHQPFTFLNTLKIKACLLCILTIVAGTPNLHAQTQCLNPYETNCVVGGCSQSGCTYTLTVKDDTPGAYIQYYVYAVGGGQVGSGQVGSGQVVSGGSFTATSSSICYPQMPGGTGGCYPSGGLYGYMYAHANGYSDSNQVSLSF